MKKKTYLGFETHRVSNTSPRLWPLAAAVATAVSVVSRRVDMAVLGSETCRGEVAAVSAVDGHTKVSVGRSRHSSF